MLDIIKKAAIIGGDVLKKYYKHHPKISYKTNFHDLLTLADKESQKMIIDFLKLEFEKIYPNSKIAFISEEGIFEQGDYTFIIDPLDGTTNFATGINHFCVSIALAKKDKIIAGVVYDPLIKSIYWAESGRGSYLNSKRLTISSNTKLSESILFIHFSSGSEAREKIMDISKNLGEKVRAVRAMGAVALDLARASEGYGYIILNLRTSIWDIAAGSLIFKEAGGEVVDLQGKTLVYDFVHDPQKKYQFVAAEKNILKQFLSIIAPEK